MFKTLATETDNSNRIQSGNFFFLVENGKKEKKRKKQMLHTYRMNHLTSGKTLKDQEHITHLGAGVGLSKPPEESRGQVVGLPGPGHPGREGHHLRAPDPDSGQGWRVPKIHEARHGKATEEKPTVNHR